MIIIIMIGHVHCFFNPKKYNNHILNYYLYYHYY